MPEEAIKKIFWFSTQFQSKEVLIKYNIDMSSSESIERMFSLATIRNLPKSHKMSEDLFEKSVVIKKSLNHLKI